MCSELTVLVVEDEYFIAADVAHCLQRWGYVVMGPVASVSQARQLIAARLPAAAVLDIQLGDELSYALASELTELGVPLLFRSGHSDCDLPPEFRRYALVSKLSEPVELQRALEALLAQH